MKRILLLAFSIVFFFLTAAAFARDADNRFGEVDGNNACFSGAVPPCDSDPILTSAAKGDVRELQRILNHDISQLEVQDIHGNTPLMFAVSNGRVKAVEFLVSRRANVNVQNRWGRTPLHAAAEGGFFEITRLLVRNGARVNARDNNGETAITKAERRRHTDVSRYLQYYRASR